LNRGGIIGIVIGVLVFLVTVAGFCVVWQGKRRRRRILAEKARASGYEWQAKHGAIGNSPQEHSGPFFDSPLSQRPFANAWGDHEASPVSANVEKAYFSPYSSQYTSPVSANDRPMHPQEWPTDSKRTLSPDGPSLAHDWGRDSKKGISTLGMQRDEGENIEMTGIVGVHESTPPMLSHPGHGRASSQQGLTEGDVKKENFL
jgi:hypothetical protein